jgi:hypothetical protein
VKRIRKDCETLELRGAKIHKATTEYPCDVYQCPNQQVVRGNVQNPAIKMGDTYALTSTKLRFCAAHYLPEEIVNER